MSSAIPDCGIQLTDAWRCVISDCKTPIPRPAATAGPIAEKLATSAAARAGTMKSV